MAEDTGIEWTVTEHPEGGWIVTLREAVTA
jgi:hypothetical protein